MGKTMSKSTVIYGQQHAVAVSSFNSSHVKQILNLLRDQVGADLVDPQVGTITRLINDAVGQAKSNKKMSTAYVKVGLVGSDLVLRCKEKKFFGDVEIDAILIKNYKPKAARYAEVKKKEGEQKSQQLKEQKQQAIQSEKRNRRRQNQQLIDDFRQQQLKQQDEQREQEQEEPKQQEQRTQVAPPHVPVPQQQEPPKQTVTQEQETRETESQDTLQEAQPSKPSLSEVMNRKNDEGETLRDRILRAAQKGRKLGIGKGTQLKYQEKGLFVMDERYHGEVIDHQKQRYGRHLKPLKDVWDKSGGGGLSFSKWLDEAEKGNTSVAGVAEALTLRDSDRNEPILDPKGTAGGLMIYLDDEGRKDYEVTVSGGQITRKGGKVGTGTELIFVIGPDNKVYAGPKSRAGRGERKAFNHSSFFSGGPVKSAGTLYVSGSEIERISDLSGHYTPNTAMVQAAIRKFGGHSPAWLNQVQIIVGNKPVGTGAEYLGGHTNVRPKGSETQQQQTEAWEKYSHGLLDSHWAENVLKDGEDGSWLLRDNRNRALTVSYRKGDVVAHKLAAELGKLGLNRRQLIVPGKLPRPRFETRPRQSPAYHGKLETAAADDLLKGKPDKTWLLRQSSSTNLAVFSRVDGTEIKHVRINNNQTYDEVARYMTANAGTALLP